MRAALAIALALVAGACEEGKTPAAAKGVDGVVAAWRSAGMTVTAFSPADGARYGKGECKAGQVNGVDAVLCSYKSPEEAKAAQPAALATVGETTGAALAEGSVLMVVADRRKADPEGRTINQATKVFRGR